MIKILISSNTSWSIYNFRFNLAKELKKNGYEVIIVAPYDEYSERIKEEFEYYNIYMNQKGTNPIQDIKTMKEYYKILKKENPDFMLNFTIKPNIYGNIVANFCGIKTINNIAGLGTLFIKENITTKIAKFLYKLSLKSSYKVFFQNKEDYKLFIQNKIVKQNICDILPGSGVDLEKFEPIEYQKKDDIFRFLLIARMLKEKGIYEYVSSAKIVKYKYKNVGFLLLGKIDINGILLEEIKEWEKENIIKYLGTSDNIQNEIAKVDCIVLPSFYREGTPRTLLESAAMAKPIITTDNVGCRDVVDDKITGYLCEVKNSKDLVDKMEKMLNLTEDERIEMGNKGREKIVKEFDEKIVIDKYLEVIKENL